MPDLRPLRDVAATRRSGMSAEAYVAESIRDPGAFVASGYEGGAIRMPRFTCSSRTCRRSSHSC